MTLFEGELELRPLKAPATRLFARQPLTGVFTDRVLLALQQSLPAQVHRLTRYWITVRTLQ
ncbi:hypothetical protein IFR09_16370 [Pseudomonas syringae]|nr:hypothetical protein [Pseudomonas syringae]MBD8788138.1 hypothetical protein [Pseudomonas syringae]MBD8799663.1 hypothetical protein [Pseudomonas syringae]MBD8812743.1 hypothetical protein [Pseudomonas syringae]